MKFLAISIIAICTTSAIALQDDPQAAESPNQRASQHEWLQKLVGEWDVTMKAPAEPGEEPSVVKSTESVRGIGDYFVISEGAAMFDGMAYKNVMTLGWDPRTEAFVGTWIDSMNPHMWTYHGTLDEATNTLTLEAEGPDFLGDLSDNRLYRDVIEVLGPDSKAFTSWYRDDDGEWVAMGRSESKRRKPAGSKGAK